MTEYKNRIIGSGEEPLDQILFNPRNWRVHPLNQQNALKGVLDEVGWVQEVIINQRTGHLVDGHLRCQLAAREGTKTIPVKYVDLSEEEEALVLSTLDPIAAMATTDKQKLDELFASIETENADVLKMLDDIAEKERLEYAKRDPVDAEPQIDRAAELNEKWQVVTGDLWQIGEHKLLCGDSTKREDVERVMAGEKADMVFTDPPYGIDVVGDNGNIGGDTRQAPTTKFSKVIGDDKEFDPRFLLEYGSPTFIWGGNYFAHLLPRGGRWFVWDKNRPEGLSLSDCELAWSNIEGVKVQKFKSTWDGYHVEGEKSGRIHPNQKPIKLTSDILSEITKPNEIVFDGFCGSGTTMVACQNLNRKCRAIEISPNYCAVILERMHTAFPELEIKKLA